MTNHACCKYLSHSFAEARDLSNSGNKQIFHSNLSCIFVKEIILLESNKRMKCSKRKFTFQGLDRQDCCQFGNLPAICSFCGFLYAKWKYTLNAEIVQYKDNTTILQFYFQIKPPAIFVFALRWRSFASVLSFFSSSDYQYHRLLKVKVFLAEFDADVTLLLI